MDQRKNTLYTRGKWKRSELKYSVLAILRQYQREVELGAFPHFLTAYRLQTCTGSNYGSLKTLLKKWCQTGYIRREKYANLYGYSITQRGNQCFELLTNGYFSKRQPGKFIRVDPSVILRLPAYKRGIN